MSEKKNRGVKHWPEDERPRERLIMHGPSTLSEAQLLAIIIRNGRAGRSAVDLGRELLERFGSLVGIEQAGIKEICEVEGIGPGQGGAAQGGNRAREAIPEAEPRGGVLLLKQ